MSDNSRGDSEHCNRCGRKSDKDHCSACEEELDFGLASSERLTMTMSDEPINGSKLTYKEIRSCDETVEVNKFALLRAYHDGLFDNFGNAHERMAKNRLKGVALAVDSDIERRG